MGAIGGGERRNRVRSRNPRDGAGLRLLTGDTPNGIRARAAEFDRVYVLGGGSGNAGPLDSLLVPVLYLFTNAFRYFKMGYASAIAWVIFVIILVLTGIQLWAQKYWVHYETDKK